MEDEERSFVEAARRAKRAALESAGIPAFAYRYERSHTAAEALALYRDEMGEDGPVVSVAGRVDSIRSQGKTAFLHIEDGSGRIQLYLRRDVLADAWQLVELLDLDDHLGATGRLFRTKKGEVSVRTDELQLLSKSLRPLPRGKTQAGSDGVVVHGGLADPEVRYRQRYADLAVHRDVRSVFRLRARAISWMRRYLDGLGFLEVAAPERLGRAVGELVDAERQICAREHRRRGHHAAAGCDWRQVSGGEGAHQLRVRADDAESGFAV